MDNGTNVELINECPNACEVGFQDNCELEEPKLGVQFTSTDAAYKFYISYASRIGFDVRKGHNRKNKNGIFTKVTFCCSKEGFREIDKRNTNPTYQKSISRVGCKADMSCLLGKNGNYEIVSFNANHNHELIRTPMKHMLKINRNISEAQKSFAENADKSGISIKATMQLFSTEIGGRSNVGFLDKDYRNYIHRKRKLAMQKGDAAAILQYFDEMQSTNPSYFSSMQLDEDDMITNIFWADARSISDYGLFGDVVCFDTTYQTNEYGRPFTPFVGVNHHKQTVVFGAALLYDETAESFKWLFDTFLSAMSGKQPKTILTDQSAAMANAISQVFTQSTHRLCVWHIYQNAVKHLNHVFNGSKTFTDDFSKCMYDYEDEEEWLFAWNRMLETYDLQNNDWLSTMFEIKEKWALVYGRLTFTADMKSTQRSESMNNVLKKYLNPSLDFLRFFEHYERVLVDRRYEELQADFKMMNTSPPILINACMLQHGMKIYTPEVFKLFQSEYTRMFNYDIFKVDKNESLSTYRVCYTGSVRLHHVTFEAETHSVSCSCNKFTSLGILCAHALKVLDKKNVKYIPPQYIVKRWTRDAKVRNIISYDGIEINDDPKGSMGKRYSLLCRNFREIATCASEHEKLANYANECLIELLRNLEEKSKTLFSDGVDHNANGVIGKTSSSPITNDAEAIKASGVKSKATVGRPKGRIKDPLEKRKPKQKNSTSKVVQNRKKTTQNSPILSSFPKEQHDHASEVQARVDLTQDSCVYDGFNMTLPTQMDFTCGLGTYQHNMSFTQLLQNSMVSESSSRENESRKKQKIEFQDCTRNYMN